MIFYRLSFILMTSFLLYSCSPTAYQPCRRSAFGGYTDTRTTEDTFMVNFKGNGCTSKDRVVTYALLRAAEVTIENGYSFFSVQSTVDNTRHFNDLDLPGVIVTIQCFKEKPQGISTMDASEYIKYNKNDAINPKRHKNYKNSMQIT